MLFHKKVINHFLEDKVLRRSSFRVRKRASGDAALLLIYSNAVWVKFFKRSNDWLCIFLEFDQARKLICFSFV